MKIKIVKPLREQVTNIFHLLNYVQPNQDNALTDTEIEVISAICLLPPKFEHSRFSPQGKKRAIEICKEEFGKDYGKGNFNNKIYSLLKKEYLQRDEDNIIYLNKNILRIINDLKENKKFEIIVQFDVEGS